MKRPLALPHVPATSWLAYPCSRRRALGICLAASLGLARPASAGILERIIRGAPKTKLVLDLVDLSLSPSSDDWSLYAAVYREAVQRLRPGDKMVVGTIGDVPLSRFAPVSVRSLPRTGVQLNDVEAADKVRNELHADFEALKYRPRTQRTLLLDTLLGAQQVIEGDGERGAPPWVVLCSDMLEDSPWARFDRMRLDPPTIHALIARLKARRLIPDLQGAQVMVAGAGGQDAAKYQEVRDFWMAYFKEARAVCGPGMYGRGTPRFPVAAGSSRGGPAQGGNGR